MKKKSFILIITLLATSINIFAQDVGVWPWQDFLYRGGRWCYADEKYNKKTEFIYCGAERFSEGLAAVCLDGKWGYIDETFNVVIPFTYGANELEGVGGKVYVNNRTKTFSEGLACARLDGKYGFIDKTGKTVIPFTYRYVLPFSDGLAIAQPSGGKWGFIDKSGNAVIPFVYDFVFPFLEGLARVERNGKYGFIDKTGHEIIPLSYSEASNFSHGLAAVQDGDGKWGYINQTGEVVIPLIFDYAEPFLTGGAYVQVGNAAFCIDKTGELIITLKSKKLDVKEIFPDGVAIVARTEKEVTINEYRNTFGFRWETSVSTSATQSVINKNGNEIVPFKWQTYVRHDNGLFEIVNYAIYTTGKINVIFSGKYFDSRGKKVKVKGAKKRVERLEKVEHLLVNRLFHAR